MLDSLNADESVHGILVELPLPKGISKEKVMSRLDPLKDVDGVHPVNRGYLLGGQEQLALVPATPLACIELMERAGVELRGKRVALVGRGDTVGRPLASLLIKRDATITVCHTKTVDIPAITKAAEIVVVAAGKAGLVNGDMLSEGQVVVDAGINAKEEGGITGDVDFESAVERGSGHYSGSRRCGIFDHHHHHEQSDQGREAAGQGLAEEDCIMPEVYTLG